MSISGLPRSALAAFVVLALVEPIALAATQAESAAEPTAPVHTPDSTDQDSSSVTNSCRFEPLAGSLRIIKAIGCSAQETRAYAAARSAIGTILTRTAPQPQERELQ